MTIVSLANGSIRGTLDHGMHAYKGIPYAQPLQGRARWLAPQPRRPWTGTLDATRYGGACMQFTARSRLPFPRARARYFDAIEAVQSSSESDDCLLLNVWSKTLDRNARLPVMVWIHGGAFTGGVANEVYDSARIAGKDVVAVVIQYRLGPPGFLHGSGLYKDDFCGDNRGFQDQMLALKWVQENIASFGGDPDCVTIYGESAGAFAVYQLAASPQAKGLFHRCIAMGGMAQTCAPADEYHQLTRDALLRIGVKPGDEDALIALDRPRLQALQAAVTKTIFGKGDPERYGSLSRSKIAYMGAASDSAFLPAAPLASYGGGTPNNIDLLLGTCANDGGLFSLVLPAFRSLSAKLFSNHLQGLVPNRDMGALHQHYRARHPDAASGRVYDRMNNDAFYRMPTLRAADAHAAGHPGRTFHYQLNCESAIPGLGAIHAIDVALLFRNPPVRGLLRDDAPTAQVAEQMLEAWTSFARSGKPKAPGMPEWKPYAATNRSTMVFDQTTRLEMNLDAPLLAFWREKTNESVMPAKAGIQFS